jgi:WhiB family redox-sensing transcriptional regulator
MTERVAVLVTSDPVNWMSTGACRGKSELFFAPFAERPEARVRREAQARAICQGCSVTTMCRNYARENRELGFWGGESEAERAAAGYAPTTPIIGRRRVAETAAAYRAGISKAG